MEKVTLIITIALLFGTFHKQTEAQCLQPESTAVIILENDTALCVGDCITLHGIYGTLRQTDTYTVNQLNFASYPTYPYTGTQISVNVDDIYSSLLAMPFSFCFFDSAFSAAVVGSNGILSFDQSLANAFCPWNLQTVGNLPTTAVAKGAIFGPYQDIDPSDYGQVYWQLTGTAPFRRFVASFKDIALFSSSCQSGFTPEKSQIILHENTNIIDIVIEHKSTCSSWNSGLAIEGIQNITGTKAHTVPGRNNTVWSAANEVYRFCPAGSVVPTSVTWYDDQGNTFAGTDSIQYCISSLPCTVYFEAEYFNCDTSFVLIDSFKVSGEPDPLQLVFDTAILDYPVDYFVEGCEEINFWLNHTTCNQNDTVIVVPHVTGTVTNGADFPLLDTIFVQPGANYHGVIQPIQDAVAEGFENAVVYFEIPEHNDSLSVQLVFTINDSVYVNALPYDSTKCPGETETFGIQGSDTVSYTWSPTNDLTSTNTQTTTAVLNYPITYTIGASWKNCPVVERDFSFAVDTFHLSVEPSDTEVCFGENILLEAVPTKRYPGMTFQWNPSIGLFLPDSAATLMYPTRDVTYIVTATTTNGCVRSASTDIFVRDQFFLQLTDTFFEACPKQQFQLNASGGVSYEWIPDTYLDSPHIANPTSSPLTSIIYTVYVTDDLGCKDTGEVEIQVFPAAIVELGEDITLYPGESAVLNTQGNCSFFTWTPTTYLSDPASSAPTASYSGTNIRYVVKGETPIGCSMLDSIWVKSAEGEIITLPNVFRPGGDGNSSPTLDIITRGIVYLKYFKVFNRWGEKIFETKDLEEGWDGTYKGEPQPLGTYVWVVLATDSEGKEIHLSGNTTLIR